VRSQTLAIEEEIGHEMGKGSKELVSEAKAELAAAKSES
jgi:hypothetical protein